MEFSFVVRHYQDSHETNRYQVIRPLIATTDQFYSSDLGREQQQPSPATAAAAAEKPVGLSF